MRTNLTELLGSMRFAVSLLVFICIASLIGTVVPQNQPSASYIDLFGPFWMALFDCFAVARVYNSGWFLGIMTFLVISTTLCLIRNTPKMLRAVRTFGTHIRGDSLRHMPHRVETRWPIPVHAATQQVQALLTRHGYASRLRTEGGACLLAAKKGSANRLGYVFAHAAIVVVCVGGLLDSELPVRLQVWLADKQPLTENMLIAQVPPTGRLPLHNPSFRANLLIPEGGQSSNAIVSVDDGVLVQPLPFHLKLHRFLVDYYSTGMPSSFKSEVEVTDPVTGEVFQRTIAVNEPLRYKGITVYQSSFDDGGSRLTLEAYPLRGAQAHTRLLKGEVGTSLTIETVAGQESTVSLTRLRPINVENLTHQTAPQPKPLAAHVAAVTGSAVAARNDDLVNVGPSIEYRLTGNDGQAREYLTYMRPLLLDDVLVFLTGVRTSPAQPYRYLRIPADADQSVTQFMALRALLADPVSVEQAARRFSTQQAGGRLSPELLQRAAQGAMETFVAGGFEALVARAPPEEHEKIMTFAVPMLHMSLAHLLDMYHAQQGLPPVDVNDAATQRWVQLALLALANLPAYEASVFLQLTHYDPVQASVFQVTRTPGKPLVYIGCLFLILGIFAMLYVHDRRVWVWIRPDGDQCQALAAMTTQRRTLDFEHAFLRFKADFQRLSA